MSFLRIKKESSHNFLLEVYNEKDFFEFVFVFYMYGCGFGRDC